MKVKVICIEGYWNDEPDCCFERRCAVLPAGELTVVQRAEMFDELTTEMFYLFEHDEPIVGKHLDFTVVFYNPVGEIDFGEMQ